MHLSCKDPNPNGQVQLFTVSCGLGYNTHKGHAPMDHDEITNRRHFLDVASLENFAAMAATNIQPAQMALFTKSRTGELFTHGLMANVQGFSRMAQSLMYLEDRGMTASSAASPYDNMLDCLQKVGALYVCLSHNGKTNVVYGNTIKSARMEGNHDDNGDQLTSRSVVVADESAPSHKARPLADTDTADFKEYAQKSRHAVDARDGQDILIACCWILPDD